MLDRTAFDWIAGATAKTDAALALVKRMVDWFFATYEENPGETNAMYDACSDEWELGSEEWEFGDEEQRYTTRDGLDGYFGIELASFNDAERSEIVDAAVDEIEQGGCRQWVGKSSPANVSLLRAHDHYWGKGHVHHFEADIGKTTCGKKLETCPGDMDWGTEDDINCKACLSMIERRGNGHESCARRQKPRGRSPCNMV